MERKMVWTANAIHAKNRRRWCRPHSNVVWSARNGPIAPRYAKLWIGGLIKSMQEAKNAPHISTGGWHWHRQPRTFCIRDFVFVRSRYPCKILRKILSQPRALKSFPYLTHPFADYHMGSHFPMKPGLFQLALEPQQNSLETLEVKLRLLNQPSLMTASLYLVTQAWRRGCIARLATRLATFQRPRRSIVWQASFIHQKTHAELLYMVHTGFSRVAQKARRECCWDYEFSFEEHRSEVSTTRESSYFVTEVDAYQEYRLPKRMEGG